MKIAIDAMGGDYAPKEVVAGSMQAAEAFQDTTFILYGDQTEIKKYMAKQLSNVEIIHTSEKIEGNDDPVRAVRRKKEASMVMAAQAVKDGEADALYSCGNTGALVASGLLIVGRMPQIDRPALMSTLPSFSKNKEAFDFLDLGANADSKPINIHQHAVMATHYARDIRQIENPTVGLLNIGTEENKGNDLMKKAYHLLLEDKAINFYGNIEARDILNGQVDIVVADGFTGNAVLKTMEGTAMTLGQAMKEQILSSGLKSKLGGYLVKDALKGLADKFDYNQVGAALLIGLQAPVMKSHGSSKAAVVNYTLGKTRQVLNSHMIDHLAESFSNA